MGVGLLFYNYVANTLTLDRGILIVVLAAGMWIGGRILLLATRKEVEAEIQHLLECEKVLENEISATHVMQLIPVPAILLDINKELIVKYANHSMIQLLGMKIEEILECNISDLHIPYLTINDEIIQTLLTTGRVENSKLTIHQQHYAVWGYSLGQQSQKALLMLIPTEKTKDNGYTALFDSSFYSNLSHDFFDAINAIVGFITLLEYESVEPGKKQQYLQIINANVRKIQWLISNYIQVYVKENYPLRTATDIENLNMLLDDILHRLNKEIPGLSQQLHFTITKSFNDEEAFLIIDNQLIYQLFLNLILFLYDKNNPLKIDLNYDIDSRFVKFIFKISSFSPSIVSISSIVRDFKSIKPPLSHSHELNLHIFKKLVNRIEGKTEITLVDENTALVTFSIPAQFRPILAENSAKTLQIYDKTILFDKHILVVEDIDYNRMLLKEFLADTGAILHFASTGQEALEYCRQHPYAIIILLDIQLPDTDGYQLIHELRKFCPNVIVIAQTAYTSVNDK
ncbi:MAG: response regulator, partial [Bacteroidales bacterium]